MHMRAHALERVHGPGSGRVQTSADMHTSGETDEGDRCECILAWQCVCMCVCWKGGGLEGCRWGELCMRDGETLNRHGRTMTALWVSSVSPSLPPPPFFPPPPLPLPNFPTGTNSASCHLRVLQARLKHSTPREENVSPGSGQFWQTEYILIHDKVC